MEAGIGRTNLFTCNITYHDVWCMVVDIAVKHTTFCNLSSLRVCSKHMNCMIDEYLQEDKVIPLLEPRSFFLPPERSHHEYNVDVDTLLDNGSYMRGFASLQNDCECALRTVTPFVLLRITIAATKQNTFNSDMLAHIILFVRTVVERSRVVESNISAETMCLLNVYNVLSLVVYKTMHFDSHPQEEFKRSFLLDLWTPWVVHVQKSTTKIISRRFGDKAAELMQVTLPLVSADITPSISIHFKERTLYFHAKAYLDFCNMERAASKVKQQRTMSGDIVEHIDVMCGQDEQSNLYLRRMCYSSSA